MGKKRSARRKEYRLKQERREKRKKILISYLWISLFCLVFYRIYNHFSHEVHSPWMTWLFAWPFCLGAVPSALAYSGIFSNYEGKLSGSLTGQASQTAGRTLSGIFPEDVYRFGIAALTLASLLKGIMQIAGTDSKYAGFLLIAGIAMTAAGAAGYACSFWKRRSQSSD